MRRLALFVLPLCCSLSAFADESPATDAPATDAPATPAASDTAPSADDAPIEPERWAIHGQTTFIQEFQPKFHSPYQGPQSLPAAANGRETFDASLYVGVRPWAGGEFWLNPEIEQGFGIGNNAGLAGYPNGEVYKDSAVDPYYHMLRAFFRQTIDLSGAQQAVSSDISTLAGMQAPNRVVFTFGKLMVVDIFDTNKYANDSRNDFLNWSVTNAGSFDFAEDIWGGTYGAALEWYQDRFAFRAGVFDLASAPNSSQLTMPALQQAQFVAEIEEQHVLYDQPGKLKFLYWLTRGNMGSYSDALALAAATGTTPSTGDVRHDRSKFGVVLNLEQQLSADLGLFARAGWTQPSIEEDGYTDIDSTASVGVTLAGTGWGRPDDIVGLAGVANQISHAGKLYLAAGGLGGMVGDGQLVAAGPEQIVETFYDWSAFGYAKVTADYQVINNPAYNRQRGPVSVLSLRLHAEF